MLRDSSTPLGMTVLVVEVGAQSHPSAEAAMADGGFVEAILWVVRDNSPARAFYERFGWRLDGQEKVEQIANCAMTEICYRKKLVAD